jgi:hypothetical protein
MAGPDPASTTETSRLGVPLWVVHGIVAGLLGAASVAVFFLAVDLANERPFWTPHALGSALFLGKGVPPDAAPSTVIVTGYTLVHGTVFVALGLVASFERFVTRLLPSSALGFALLTGALFAALEAIFASMAAVFVPELMARLTAGRVAAANLLAAVLMAGHLTYAVTSRDGAAGEG